ncbi:MAG: MOSC domain-containing protein [Betaproteobacteria bacterium]|nr:MOSC domain-containing protein [Betaproteobacteria bacterium]
MAHIALFIGGLRPLPESSRPTGIFKQPAAARLRLDREGFVGDRQADRRVHGGPEKAVHLYPAAHYVRLAERFPDATGQLLPGSMDWRV